MKYYAHTKKDRPETEWQELKEHLLETAQIASEFAITEFRKYFWLAGLLHDFGKYQKEFQRYLKEGGRRGSVPHAVWGAAYARNIGYNEVSITINGHHKGLPDRSDWKNDTTEFINENVDGYQSALNAFFADIGISESEIQIQKYSFNNVFELELFIRYLFSALTDADWLDTEKFMNNEITESRILKKIDHDYLINKLDDVTKLMPHDGELNRLRNSAREYAISKAEDPIGFFSMNLPTGMGKTLTSISWALRHAKKHNLKRVIIVLPYTNIIDQTARVLYEIFGDDWVLEHHSAYNEDIITEESLDKDDYSKRLACENWDYPIIVTTTVQFFESIFSNRTSKCRKVHNISNSVVIFDEVQTLPKELIKPTLNIIKNISGLMRTSFLFCTATQPAFEKREGFDGIDNIVPLVNNPESLSRITRRVNYHIVEMGSEIEMSDVISLACNTNHSILAVFNTKKAAREFYDRVIEYSCWEGTYHLSTAMCPHHRKRTIAAIREALADKKRILVSSTQLIEAGVDFDFPCVFREMAPLESIIQAAGRCNREGKMGEPGLVYIFKIAGAGTPDKLYKSFTNFTMDLLKDNPEKLHRHDFYSEYYKSLITLFVDPDKKKIDEARREFKFETVAQSYRIIENVTESLFVMNYNDDSYSLYLEIEKKLYLSRNDYRRLQQFTVNVYQYFLMKNQDFFFEDKHGIKIWTGGYDPSTGLVIEPILSDSLVV